MFQNFNKKIIKVLKIRNFSDSVPCPKCPEIKCQGNEQKIPKTPRRSGGGYRSVFLYGILPSLVAFTFYVFWTKDHPERAPFTKYGHLRIRTKPFPWDKERTLFHNKHVNPLPDGYEDETDEV